MPDNLLYYGDNLEILRRYIKDETVDLVYLDPPFNSDRTYNVLFKEQDGSRAAAQIKAFEDTWRWDQASAAAHYDLVQKGSDRLSKAMQGFHMMLGETDMLAYLAMMAPRLVDLHRVLKPTGSLYLHCDSIASHYLKLLLDAVFGPDAFGNEIIWKRTGAHSNAKQGGKNYGRVHDALLFYAKGKAWTFKTIYLPYDEEYIESHYSNVEEETGRRYRKGDLTANKGGGDTSYEWKGVRPYAGRFWAYSKKKMEEFERQGRLVYTRSGMPEYKRYLDEMPGVPLQDVWDDIPPLNSQAAERLGYPTQKPEALLERILQVSTNEGDTVLDPFCGCGSAIAVSQRLKRRWVGIDITHLAITIIKNRLRGAFGAAVGKSYRIIGEPQSMPDAVALALQDRTEFQRWIVGKLAGRPVEVKKGKDKGIDGRLYFQEVPTEVKVKQAIISVKSGATGPKDLRDLRGVIDREKAAIGVLVTLEDPTRDMRTEAASGGYYESPWTRRKHPRLQILTVEEILAGDAIDMPPSQQTSTTYPRARPAKGKKGVQQEIFEQ